LSEHACVYNPQVPHKRYPIKVLARDATLDLAILQPPTDPGVWLELGQPERVRRLDVVTLAGYPQFARGHTLSVVLGKVSGIHTVSTIKLASIDAPIIKGHSGAPLLDKNNKVIGVAVRGANQHDVADASTLFGVVLISELNRLTK
jgi:S1-C subfamily serine protease